MVEKYELGKIRVVEGNRGTRLVCTYNFTELKKKVDFVKSFVRANFLARPDKFVLLAEDVYFDKGKGQKIQ